ncbi:YjbH domain-containing protein [Aeromicrobium ginsengisoli]|uniref:YjbH domain-containing protein n=1 Tax=Aeromicrobium ginsengisoli TaxID=363867 RepID=A0A5M4FF51_9ACTN|nr:YjbH domain-containing protein [Aeromicrobium ginsengisoli]KAA1397840.1 YjbH domain-containing protein [Aeromicrobium ginsengisoli]
MVDTDIAVARLQLAIEQSESLQRGLRHRQEDLLSLERDVRDVAAGRTTGRAVIDQAEVIRRAVRYHTTDQLEEIHVALTRADMAVAEAVSDRTVEPAEVRALSQLVNAAGEEARRATMDLQDVNQALKRTSQAVPGEPGLAASAQRSIDEAAGRLENARRATFQVVEDLPAITRAIQEMSAADPAGNQPDIPTEPTITEQRRLGIAAELRRTAPANSQRISGFAPER